MKTKRFLIGLIVAFAAGLANVISVFAYPAEMPDVTPMKEQSDTCRLFALSSAQIDIPSHRIDYILLNRVLECAAAGTKVNQLIMPVTRIQENRYANFKLLQADLMSGGEFAFRTADRSRFYEFKARQAEERSY